MKPAAQQPPKKILVPCDGSKPSANALAKAAELFMPACDGGMGAKQTEIILLYAIPYIEVPLPLDESGMGAAADSPETRQHTQRLYLYLRDRALDMLQKLADKFVDRDRFAVRIEVAYGSPAEKIIEFAHKEKSDVIVMGNIGLSGFSKLKALGSVSRSVSERAKVPVMIVPHSQ
jgi:nucleotide-binding universal stress UspA family protein